MPDATQAAREPGREHLQFLPQRAYSRGRGKGERPTFRERREGVLNTGEPVTLLFPSPPSAPLLVGLRKYSVSQGLAVTESPAKWETRKRLKKEVMNEFVLAGRGGREKDLLLWVKRRRQGGRGTVCR